MRAAETKAGLGEALTAAAARSYHRLLAVKDEWEVARLFAAPEFAKALAEEFEGPFKIHFHIGAWPFARPDPRTGVMGKGEAGPWAMTAFRLMARLRFLRGTLLDPFRNSDERKLERRLIAEFEADIDELVAAPRAGEPRARRPHREPARDDQGLRAGEGGERRGSGESARQRAAAIAGRESADGAGGMSIEGKTIVVTGGFGALGAAVAEAAIQRGASVAALDFAPAAPAGLAERLGPNALIVGGFDLSLPHAAQRAMAEVTARFGRIDALLNIAGGFRWEKIADAANAESWDRMFAINLKTALNASRAALPHLLESGAGRIVNVGAQAGGSRARRDGAPMRASKAAVHRLTESLADELKLKGVTVNAVLPSIIDTPANRADMPDADFSRWVSPADLAAVILFLASDEARAVTGALIPVTGRV